MGHRPLEVTGVLILFLIGLARAGSGPSVPPGVPEGYVATPNGWFDPSCVIEVQKDERLNADGTIERADGLQRSPGGCEHPRYDREGHQVVPQGSSVAPLPAVNAYAASASETVDGSLGFISANWKVPPAPVIDRGQTVFYFPGVQPTTAGKGNPNATILQPVLGWNQLGQAQKWTIASWNCCIKGMTQHTQPIAVNAGDVLYGAVGSSQCSGGSHAVCKNWKITTRDQRTGTSTSLDMQNTFNEVEDLGFAGALEAYGIQHCAQYPKSGSVQFYTLVVRNAAGVTLGDVRWQPAVTSELPQCGYSVPVTPTAISTKTYPTTLGAPKPPPGCGIMHGGYGLSPNHATFSSCNRVYGLNMQLDGNLVLYHSGRPIWATNTPTGRGYGAIMQGDGNFVLYDLKSQAMWASRTNGHPGAYLALQDDGNMVVYYGGRALWASRTNGK